MTANDLHQLEGSLILGKPADSAPELFTQIVKGHYRGALLSQTASLLFGTHAAGPEVEALVGNLDADAFVSDRVTTFLRDAPLENAFEVQCLGIACLYSFLQSAWTGPVIDLNPTDLLPAQVRDKEDVIRKRTLERLVEDGEEVYSLTPKPLFLLLAKAILVDGADKLGELKMTEWWKARCLFVQQRVLENPSGTLQEMIEESLGAAEKKLPKAEDADTREISARFYVERGLIEHYYSQDSKALKFWKTATESSNFTWSLTGALGRRTKFQTFDVAQLVVVAESSPDADVTGSTDLVPNTATPQTLALNDDTLLETIQYTGDKGDGVDPEKQGNLKVIDQCILIAHCLNVKNVNPDHGLTTEQMMPYIRRVLANPNNWMVHTMALLVRSRLESTKTRTVERSCFQLQALVDQFGSDDSAVEERMAHIFSTLVPPKWEMERELGERFVSLGVVRSALEIYQRLEMWDDVISCYQMLEKTKQAEELVLERLKITPKSPKLHCILGDLRKDPNEYMRAWEFSDGRYARAMRSLGAHYYRLGEWVKAIECYHRALAVNPLFENSWFVMGCAAMRAEDWDHAVRAFSRCTSINYENGEAWNNLASAYIRQGKKRDAWRALQQAVREHFDNSKIWDNYMFTSIDLGEFAEAMRAMERVMDLRWDKPAGKEIALDVEVLEILVNAVVDGVNDSEGESASKLAPRLSAFLDNVTNKIPTSAPIFALQAHFFRSQNRLVDALESLQKSYRVLLHHPRMADDEEQFKKTVEGAMKLVDGFKELGPMVEQPRMGAEGEGRVVCKDWAYQARMVLRTLIGRTKITFEDHPLHDSLKEKLTEITEASR